jgi:AAA15 family ATPase/GTPase
MACAIPECGTEQELWFGALCGSVEGSNSLIFLKQRLLEHIKNIEIKNFKSIRHQKIEDCRRINVFIGYPNVGKSNLLEALSLFSINEATDFSSIIRMENYTTLFFNGNIEQPASVIVNGKFVYRVEFSNGIVRFYYNLDSDKKETGSETLRRFEFSENRIDGFSQSPQYRRHASLEIKKYEFLKNINYGARNLAVLEHPYGNNIFDVISSNEQIRKEVSDLFKQYDLKFSFDKSARAFKILKTVGEDIFLIPYSMIADTLQRLIFYKASILSNKESVLLFEEPEAHMFPPYMRRFTTDVIFDKTNQFFIATHSPYILDALMEDAPDDLAIHLVYYENGETKVKRMQQKDMDEVRAFGVDLFFNLESYLKHGQIDNA